MAKHPAETNISRATGRALLADLPWLLPCVAAALFLLSRPPVYTPDSDGYVLGAYFRAPLYPLLLKTLNLLFGQGMLRAVVVLQTSLVLLAATRLAWILQACGYCSRRLGYTVFLASCAAAALFTDQILAEAVGFALSLLFFSELARGATEGRLPWTLSPICMLALLVRVQFVWLLVIFCLMALAMRDRGWRLPVRAVVASLCMLLAFSVAARAFNAMACGKYAYTSLAGVHFLGNALYIAPDSTPELFQHNQTQHDFIAECLDTADKHHMRWKHWNSGYTPQGFYRAYYAGETTFLFNLEYTLGNKYGLYDFDVSNGTVALQDMAIVTFDVLCMDMAKRILVQNKVAYLKHVARKAMDERLGMIFFAVLLAALTAAQHFKSGALRPLLLCTSALGMLTNYAMLCMANIIHSRYGFTSEFFFLLLSILYLLDTCLLRQGAFTTPPDPEGKTP